MWRGRGSVLKYLEEATILGWEQRSLWYSSNVPSVASLYIFSLPTLPPRTLKPGVGAI